MADIVKGIIDLGGKPFTRLLVAARDVVDAGDLLPGRVAIAVLGARHLCVVPLRGDVEAMRGLAERTHHVADGIGKAGGLDAWAAKQEDNPSRSEAIRRLAERQLDAESAAAPKKGKR